MYLETYYKCRNNNVGKECLGYNIEVSHSLHNAGIIKKKQIKVKIKDNEPHVY